MSGELQVPDLQVVTPEGVVRFEPAALAGVTLGAVSGDVVKLRAGGVITGLVVTATFLIDLVAPAVKAPDRVHQLALTAHLGQPMVGRWDVAGVAACLVLAYGGTTLRDRLGRLRRGHDRRRDHRGSEQRSAPRPARLPPGGAPGGDPAPGRRASPPATRLKGCRPATGSPENLVHRRGRATACRSSAPSRNAATVASSPITRIRATRASGTAAGDDPDRRVGQSRPLEPRRARVSRSRGAASGRTTPVGEILALAVTLRPSTTARSAAEGAAPRAPGLPRPTRPAGHLDGSRGKMVYSSYVHTAS